MEQPKYEMEPVDPAVVTRMKYGTYESIIRDFIASGATAAKVRLTDADGNSVKQPGTIVQGLRAVVTRKKYDQVSVSLVRGTVILENMNVHGT